MTPTIDVKAYGELLLQHCPRVIKSEDENEQFLAIVEELLAHPNLTPEEDALLELLVKLIEDFEEKQYPLDQSTPRSRLLHLVEAQNLEASDLAAVLGTREIADCLMNGQQEINQQQAEALGRFFHIDPTLFLED